MGFGFPCIQPSPPCWAGTGQSAQGPQEQHNFIFSVFQPSHGISTKELQREEPESREEKRPKLPKNLCTCRTFGHVAVFPVVWMGMGFPPCPIPRAGHRGSTNPCTPTLTPVLSQALKHCLFSPKPACSRRWGCPPWMWERPPWMWEHPPRMWEHACSPAPAPSHPAALCWEMKGGSSALTRSYFTKMLF